MTVRRRGHVQRRGYPSSGAGSMVGTSPRAASGEQGYRDAHEAFYGDPPPWPFYAQAHRQAPGWLHALAFYAFVAACTLALIGLGWAVARVVWAVWS